MLEGAIGREVRACAPPVHHDGDEILTVPGLLTGEECRRLIEIGETLGFEAATVGFQAGARLAPEIRNNDRATIDDVGFSAAVWERVRGAVPAEDVGGRRACGLNPRWRFYRYDPGQRFRRHQDGVVALPNGERSRYSFLIYLNADYYGGETTFTDYAPGGDGDLRRRTVRIAPEVGMGLFFVHERWHEGTEVTRGRKYLLRSDVTYAAERVVPAGE